MRGWPCATAEERDLQPPRAGRERRSTSPTPPTVARPTATASRQASGSAPPGACEKAAAEPPRA
eukprot:CAMPEP_0204585090 /NCGR_PEP_ID=MMETSP0661-20131031/46720_1 /ASSEMBLY_ACC=CAM_ASM_000606 /TAXON_ID=109239 /ORGANISM="Alexandrium margalefi, Strain AMGDE01CS-322" /LENGTH=63 /DNA_ID=CAMNT_0051594615 /DNA_START=65 /DNA_END=256 /DNA_ORIENTATION=+